ncbi:phage host-nuclease inhibitor protein Gam [Anaerosolibacter carboniphilus]|uniref:Phage host-nuclease inhibitor protein Gam n=1 Tax=Anaerosolibacter carboniphilus TaxID=1417629 RepID=A0A841KQC3_9FIRM|nr:host-nuclease inhibitor Gam family protein [Anaerosolibacter carboniphilus]MBB6215627.1 phage host-nuclease inhibitor protein Gam [Anaerosolibacter carboniphilus]
MLNQLDLLEIEEVQQSGVQENRFIINDIEGVNWAFRKIKAYHNQKAEIEALAKAEIERIQTWLVNEAKQIDESIAFFEGKLTEYAVVQREADPKFKCSTPYGKIGFRKQQPKWEYDEEKAIHSLKEAGLKELIRVKEEPKKDEIKKLFRVVDGKAVDPDGQIIDGITITDREDKLEIKVVE